MHVLLTLWGDLRYAARCLALSPGFTSVAVVTIALGVGINTGIFSVLNSVALRGLPAPDADELVSIHQDIEGVGLFRPMRGARSLFSTSEFRAYRDVTQTLSGIMGFSRPETVTLGRDSPAAIDGAIVTCNYFDVLKQPLALGRGFTADNCEVEGAPPAVVLGHDLWVAAFSADPAIIGRDVLLNRQALTVVGVVPEGVHGVDILKVSFFAPIATQPLLSPGSNAYQEESSWLTLIGRRRDEASLDQVRAELGIIAARIDQLQPPRRTTLIVDRARPVSAPEDSPVILTVGGVVMTAFGLILLIACANVANLVFARAEGRAPEIAVRQSLGASRARIVQQLLAESMLIAAAGGVLGTLLAIWSFQTVVALALSALPAEASSIALDARPDIRVLTVALALTVMSGALFGISPAIHSSRVDLHTATKGDAGRSRGGSGPRGTLLGGQVATCMVLMIMAGLFLRGLNATQTVEPGFAYENIAVAELDLTGSGYGPLRATDFQRRLRERVAALPGIEGVAQSAITPLAPSRREMMVRLPGRERWDEVLTNTVSPGYFALLEIPIIQGRTFSESEFANGSQAMIVTAATARRLWPDRDAIGQTLTANLGPRYGITELRVVGVAADAQITAIGEIDSAFVYLPAVPAVQAGLNLLAKGGIDFETTAAGIRTTLAELDPALVARIAPLEANLDFWQRIAGLMSSLSMSLGALAVALAAVGIYGMVSYAVGQRVREIGIRIALGAGARDVLAAIMRRTMWPVVVGAFLGIAIAIGLSKALSSVLFGVSPVDPIGIAGASLVVIGITFAAGVLAAQPATRSDPMRALRDE
jgi:predicted permease